MSGNSCTQGPHQVAQKLTSSSLPVGIGAQLLQVFGRRHLEPHRFGFDLLLVRNAVRLLLLPLGGTAKNSGFGDGHRLSGKQGLDRVARVLGFHQLLAIAVVDASLVAQLAVLVEDENVRRGLRPERPRYGLRLAVIKVWIAQVFVRDADLHFIETVAGVGGIQLVDADGVRDHWAEWPPRPRLSIDNRRRVSECAFRRSTRSGSDCR